MVLSMNTLPKYDIADIVSHISGEMQPADAQSSEGHSFADLLKEAIKNIPESNAEANVAESGKSLPQSPLNEKEIKSQRVAEGLSESELNNLFRQVLSGDSPESAGGASLDTEKIDSLQLKSQENSDLLANLRAALKFRSSDTTEIDNVRRESVKSHSDTGIKLASLSQEGADDRIRVATLKERRPVILGPGSYNDELHLKAMANYFSDERFLPAHQADSQNLAQLDKANFSAENFKETTKQLGDKIEITAGLDSGEHGASTVQFLQQKAETDFMNKEDKKSDAIIKRGSPEHIIFHPSESRQTDFELQSEKLQGPLDQRSDTKFIKGVSNSNRSAQKEAQLPLDNSFKHSEPSEKVQSLGLNDYAQSTREYEPKKYTEEFRNQPSQVDAVRIGENQRDPKEKFVSKNPQEFDPKIGAYLEDSDVLKSVKSQPPVDTRARSLISDNALRQSQVPSDFNKQNISTPAVALESQRELESDIERKFVNNELRHGFRLENPNITGNPGRAGKAESGILIQIGEYSNRSDVDNSIVHAADDDLTIEGSDSSLKTPGGEKSDVLRSDLLASLQSDKTLVSNRSDLAPRTVAVSNFSSGMQEAIMGHLTRTSAGTSKFTVALFPENLGKISIEISYSELAGMKITMVGDNPEATKILEQNLPALRENLQTDKLNELLVNLNTNKDSSGSNQKYSQSDEGSFANNEDRDVGTKELTDSKSETYDNDNASDSETGLDTYV
jgi:hypothetical protein